MFDVFGKEPGVAIDQVVRHVAELKDADQVSNFLPLDQVFNRFGHRFWATRQSAYRS